MRRWKGPTTGGGTLAEPGTVTALADEYIERSCELDPIKATAGRAWTRRPTDRLLTVGVEERRRARARHAGAPRDVDSAGHRGRAPQRRLHDRTPGCIAGNGRRRRAPSGAAQHRQSVAGHPTDLRPDVARVGRRLGDHRGAHGARTARAWSDLRISLDEGRVRQIVSARRQATEAAEQCAVWSGERGTAPFFEDACERRRRSRVVARVAGALDDAAAVGAPRPSARWASWLRDVYAPAALETDAVGADRYRLFALASLGAEVDLDRDLPVGLGRAAAASRTRCAANAARIGQSDDIGETIDWLETRK